MGHAVLVGNPSTIPQLDGVEEPDPVRGENPKHKFNAVKRIWRPAKEELEGVEEPDPVRGENPNAVKRIWRPANKKKYD